MKMTSIKGNSIFYSIAIFILIILAIILRIYLLPFFNNDLSVAFVPWFEYLINHNGLFAIHDLAVGSAIIAPFSYSPPYLYLLAAAIPLSSLVPSLYVIKIVSGLFDFVSAFFVFKIIELKYPLGIKKWIGFLCVCFAPTVFINSAYWGQIDGIYSSFLIISMYFLLSRKPALSLIFFSTALAFKIQAIIFAPIFVVLLFRRKIQWQLFFLIPATYFLWMIPAYLLGYPITGTFSTYLSGTNYLHSLTMNAPNIYVALSNQYYDILMPLGLILGVIICGFLIWMAIHKKIDSSYTGVLFFIVLMTIIIPFVLPKMHDRYFYPAAMFAIILPFYLPKLRLVPIALQSTSLLSYTSFLRGREILPLAVPAFINGILVCVLVYLFFKDYSTKKK